MARFVPARPARSRSGADRPSAPPQRLFWRRGFGGSRLAEVVDTTWWQRRSVRWLTPKAASTEIPTVLRADLYALAALAGAAVVVIGAALQLPSTAVTIAGAVLCFGLRFMAIRRGWDLPLAEGLDQLNTKARAPNDRKNDGARRR